MIFYLRTQSGENIIDTEIYSTMDTIVGFDLHSTIYPKGYGRKIIGIHNNANNEEEEFMSDIDELNDLRGLYWELLRYQGIREKSEMIKVIETKYKEVADKYELRVVTD
mgnify:FL=1